MSIHVYRKNTAGRRNMSIVKPEGVSEGTVRPEKSLTTSLSKKSGRSHGKISVRHKGGGHKRRYRLVDFSELTHVGIPATVVSIEKDPNRSGLIALLQYANGAKAYVLAAAGVSIGQSVMAGPDAPVAPGNRLHIKNIPIGTAISNLELFPGKGGQIARSAGSSAVLMSIDGEKAQIRLSSGEIRLVNIKCYATVGGVSNFEHGAEKIGKAGRNRWKGKRPAVRGSAMNPVDHPHGGGEGRQGIGLKHPKTPWGKPALGKKTRRKKLISNQYIVKRRSKK